MKALQTLLYLYTHTHTDDEDDDALLPLNFSRKWNLSYQGWEMQHEVLVMPGLLVGDAAETPHARSRNQRNVLHTAFMLDHSPNTKGYCWTLLMHILWQFLRIITVAVKISRSKQCQVTFWEAGIFAKEWLQ